MQNVVIILAGGIGQRMGASVPKQFIEVKGKPIIVHTIENFERNSNVDAILIVCNADWIDHFNELVTRFNLKKVKWIVPGGETSHDSTRNGIFALRDILAPEDFIIIHDAARPILPQKAIDEMLRVAHEKGNASLAIPCYETVIFTEDQKSGTKELDRNQLMRVQTPQAYKYDLILPMYEKAEMENKHDFVYADLVVIYYGEPVYFAKGFVNNIKITRPEDIPLMESLMAFKEDDIYSI